MGIFARVRRDYRRCWKGCAAFNAVCVSLGAAPRGGWDERVSIGADGDGYEESGRTSKSAGGEQESMDKQQGSIRPNREFCSGLRSKVKEAGQQASKQQMRLIV